MRIDKVIEMQLQTSRKEMKRLFAKGLVCVNGQMIRNQAFNVDSHLHQLTVNGQLVEWYERYWLVNKPAGYVTANHDKVAPTIFDLFDPKDFSEGLYAVGRLDRDTEGLVLVTSNGPLGFQLLHPTKKVEKIYQVRVNARLTSDDVRAFATGIVFYGGVQCQPAKLVLQVCHEKESWALVSLSEGKFHQVKKMFLACGKKVTFLKRIAFGPLQLGGLPVGGYRPLASAELEQLRPFIEGGRSNATVSSAII